MKKVQKAADKAIARLVFKHKLSYKDAEDAVLEVLKENTDELKSGEFGMVINCLNLL